MTDNPISALWFVIYLIVLQQVAGSLIYPKVVGESVGLPALWVLISVVVLGGLFGIVGMLVAGAGHVGRLPAVAGVYRETFAQKGG